MAEGQAGKAAELLEQLLAAAKDQGRSGSAVDILVLLALARQGSGEAEGSLAALASALTLAEPEGHIRTFVDKGRPVADLLRRVAASGAMATYASRLLASFDVPGRVSYLLADPLTERELEVLRRVGASLSNQEIAQELVSTVGTAKWHVHNILDKLEVRRRTGAVARARELGLL